MEQLLKFMGIFLNKINFIFNLKKAIEKNFLDQMPLHIFN